MIGEPDAISDAGVSISGLVKEYNYSSKGFSIIASPNNIDNDYYIINRLSYAALLLTSYCGRF